MLAVAEPAPDREVEASAGLDLAAMTTIPGNTDDRTLLIAYQRDGSQPALEELTERYLPLARGLAGRYRHTNESQEDLIQVANMALVKAIQRFDTERGVAFSSFAVPTILGELKRYFRDHSWSVHVPRGLQERGSLVNRTVDTLSERLGRSPSVNEVAAELDLDLEQVLEGLEAAQAFNASSLDADRQSDDEGAGTLGDLIGDDDPGYDLVEYGASVEDVLNKMPNRTRQILHLRFRDDLTQTEIAQRVDISQMHVSRIIRHALAELRASIPDEEG